MWRQLSEAMEVSGAKLKYCTEYFTGSVIRYRY
jgi:hypothetical protein